ncbi:O-succinylbenzoate synthase [Pontibacillus halophilus JSM 076056 = DSM 19796]|uniref:o-succinylbenzoate synthase n=1 Tax=Pontibacillus halophilus JSM 076056 = DSM 19796 TaxID=1385510 RepID=A0A0A5G8R0_9BACI|nr:o-succinylbenzoate synthase [Pontibacillus halophilus]KGX89511.1 O-succinylbenzoate synthase [Pontibacillus halophilus JSM 076056 = DSM 19796]
MHLTTVTVSELKNQLKTPFKTHAGVVHDRHSLLIELRDKEGNIGYGECVAFSTPFYSEETVQTGWHMLTDVFIPHLKANLEVIEHPRDVCHLLKGFQGNQMAKAGLDLAAWDLYAKQRSTPLFQLIGGLSVPVEVGVVVSLSEQMEELLPYYEAKGYKRVKLKVQKGEEKRVITKAKQIAPNLSYMIDGNGMYTEEDMDWLVSLDSLGLLMIEQPFRAGDFYLHAQLQRQMETPISLDETITSYADAKQAIALQSCRIMNIKLGRVGGFTEALRIYDLCRAHGIPLWCGGMLELGVSRAHSLALSSLAGFTIPGDISASSRYWHRDITKPPIELVNGKLPLPEGEGIGYQLDLEQVNHMTLSRYEFNF